MMLFVILCDGEFDGVWESERQAKREKRDLEKMGFTVKIKKVASWADADALEAKLRGH